MKVNQEVKDIISSLYGMTDSEVRMINQAAYNILNDKRKAEVREAKRKLHPGMQVTFRGRTGTIVKINRTKCVVDTGEFRRWNVPITMVSPV